MVHLQLDVILHLTADNLDPNGKPIINVGDLISFTEADKNSKTYVTYEVFFRLVNRYFEYTEHGTKEHRTIKITGLLTKYQQ